MPPSVAPAAAATPATAATPAAAATTAAATTAAAATATAATALATLNAQARHALQAHLPDRLGLKRRLLPQTEHVSRIAVGRLVKGVFEARAQVRKRHLRNKTKSQ